MRLDVLLNSEDMYFRIGDVHITTFYGRVTGDESSCVNFVHIKTLGFSFLYPTRPSFGVQRLYNLYK